MKRWIACCSWIALTLAAPTAQSQEKPLAGADQAARPSSGEQDEPSQQELDALRAELKSYPHRILFEAYKNNNWDLYRMDADGGAMVNVTNTPDLHEMYAQASPDGQKICFLQDTQDAAGATRRDVMLMLADGTRQLVAEKARQPCWAPDSRRLALVRQEFPKFNIADYVSKGLFVYDLQEQSLTEAANKDVHHIYGLNWSAQGDWIVTTVHGGMGFRHAIIAIDLHSQVVKDLGVSGCRPCLSADGSKIAWSGNDHTINIAEVRYDEGSIALENVRVLYQREHDHLYHPDISPDGKYVVFSVGPGGRVAANGPGTHTQVAEMVGVRGQWRLFLKRFNGEGPVLQLTDGDEPTSKEAEWQYTAPTPES